MRRWDGRTIRSLTGLALAALLTSGCGEISLGPRTKETITFVERSTKTERTAEIVQLLESFKTEVLLEGEHAAVIDTMELHKGAKLIRPDIAHVKGLQSVRIAKNQFRHVALEDGGADTLNVGGWYVWTPGVDRE